MAFVGYDGDHAKAKTGATLIDCDAVMIRALVMDSDARGDIQIVGVLDSDTECNTAGASERPSTLDGCDKGTSVGTFELVGCPEEDTNSDADGTAEIVGTRDGPRGRSVDEVADTVQDQVSADTVSVTMPEDTADTDNTIDPQETVSSEPDTIDYPGRAFTEVKRIGVAELIVEDEPSSKFLALHKTAEVGTVIKIRNLKNDLTVYVRVVGQIPDTADNENVLIKINKRAHDQLKAIDPRFRVELSYFQ